MDGARTLIVGNGEVGRALLEVLAPFHPCEIIDKTVKPVDLSMRAIDVMHICFGWSDGFSAEVARYAGLYRPRVVVVHSTVPVGTCRELGVLHSPIRGQHPNLADGIRTFPKMIGGFAASRVADYFRRAGLKVELYDKQETTEAAKLFDTEYYRVCIEFARRVKAYCDAYGLSFHEVYTLPNIGYNLGYLELDRREYVRPILQPITGPIGGHCVLPNAELIKIEPH